MRERLARDYPRLHYAAMHPVAIAGLLGNLLLGFGAFFYFPSLFSETTSYCFFSSQFVVDGGIHRTAPLGCGVRHCYAAALLGSGAAVSTIIAFARHRISPAATLVALIIHAGALLFLFAGVYLGFGLVFGSNEIAKVERSDALYFSVVTWTTLGYGDFAPRAAIRLVAGMQALLGYIFFGLIVGLLADYLKSDQRNV